MLGLQCIWITRFFTSVPQHLDLYWGCTSTFSREISAQISQWWFSRLWYDLGQASLDVGVPRAADCAGLSPQTTNHQGSPTPERKRAGPWALDENLIEGQVHTCEATTPDCWTLTSLGSKTVAQHLTSGHSSLEMWGWRRLYSPCCLSPGCQIPTQASPSKLDIRKN